MSERRFSGSGRKKWDVVVIGTGMGGAVLGHALAKAGKSVLFCEKGKSHLRSGISVKGDYAEAFSLHGEYSRLNQKEILSRAGRFWDEIEDLSNAGSRKFIPFIGSGTGGSSALYGMALERFFPADFSPRQYHPNASESSLPERWPISYDEMAPYYEAAERMFRVHGSADPLKENQSFGHLLPALPLTPASKELYDFFLNNGLRPYNLPIACEFVSNCECCQSYLCDKDCKNDSSRICLSPAISDFGAQLIDECEIIKLEATRDTVTRVVCRRHDRLVSFRGEIVVLAAGALESPKILLKSASSAWPDGLANDSGLVGRNLMRHFIDLYAVTPKTKGDYPTYFKEIAFNDLYIHERAKFGTVQSFGAMPPPEILTKGIKDKLKAGSVPLAVPLFLMIEPIIQMIIKKIFSGKIVLASIMEDLPYIDNRVILSGKADEADRRTLAFSYRIRESERLRISAFRKEISRILGPYSFKLIRQAENNERIAHACGTCRFGLNPKDSVLDKNNRAHGLSNLYIVDSSFFPSSGGTNPALTIASNALRVARHLIDRKIGPHQGEEEG